MKTRANKSQACILSLFGQTLTYEKKKLVEQFSFIFLLILLGIILKLPRILQNLGGHIGFLKFLR